MRFEHFLTLAPEVDKMGSRKLVGSRIRQNELQENQFNHFLALAPEVDRTVFKKFDLETRDQRPDTRE